MLRDDTRQAKARWLLQLQSLMGKLLLLLLLLLFISVTISGSNSKVVLIAVNSPLIPGLVPPVVPE
jgi:hypothetical protein